MRQLILIENLEDGEQETALYFEDTVEVAFNGPFITIKDDANCTVINITNLVGFSLVDIEVAERRSFDADECLGALHEQMALEAETAAGCDANCDCHTSEKVDEKQFDCHGECQQHCVVCLTRETKIQEEIDDENS